MFIQAHLKVYYSDAQMLVVVAQKITIIRPTASYQASVFCNVKLYTQTIYLCIYYDLTNSRPACNIQYIVHL